MYSAQSYLARRPKEVSEIIIRAYCADPSSYEEQCVLIACLELARRRGEEADFCEKFRQLCQSFLESDSSKQTQEASKAADTVSP